MPVDDAQRISELERQVRVLSAGLKLDEPLFAMPEPVVHDLDAGQYVKAVKTLRRHAGGSLSLVAAKKMLDEFQQVRPPTNR